MVVVFHQRAHMRAFIEKRFPKVGFSRDVFSERAHMRALAEYRVIMGQRAHMRALAKNKAILTTFGGEWWPILSSNVHHGGDILLTVS